MHEVLVNRLGGLSLPRKSVVRLTDRPDMTLEYDIESYCTLWDLNINTAKTQAMIFEKGRHTHYDFYLNNVKFEIVTSFKYLGMYFFKNGNWS